eukprot:2570604-Lingulodinium_polyedra.AAC.1
MQQEQQAQERPMSAPSERSCAASPAAGRPRRAGGRAVPTASCGAPTMAFSEAIEASASGRMGEHAADTSTACCRTSSRERVRLAARLLCESFATRAHLCPGTAGR